MRLAGLLVIYTTQLKGTPKQQLLDKQTEDMRQNLETRDLALYSRLCPEVIAWVLFIGAYSSFDTPGFRWFLLHIQDNVPRLDLQGWPQARALLKRLPYIDKEFDYSFEGIWNLAHKLNTEIDLGVLVRQYVA